MLRRLLDWGLILFGSCEHSNELGRMLLHGVSWLLGCSICEIYVELFGCSL
jgi:hypothetical protein